MAGWLSDLHLLALPILYLVRIFFQIGHKALANTAIVKNRLLEYHTRDKINTYIELEIITTSRVIGVYLLFQRS